MEGTGHPSQPRSLNIVRKEAPPRFAILLKGIAEKGNKNEEIEKKI